MKKAIVIIVVFVLWLGGWGVVRADPILSGPFEHSPVFYEGKELTGKGVKIGIIDTGVDYHHPDLRDNYRGGFDFIDYDYDPMETRETAGKDTSHGTHVAGIIAGNGVVEGIAKDAQIYAYRALGPGGSGSSDSVMRAIRQAIADGMDIINLSLGNDVNGPDFPTTVALNEAVQRGVIAVVANGNSGPKMWTVGSPATAHEAISVGAFISKQPQTTFINGKHSFLAIPFINAMPFAAMSSFLAVDAGYGENNEVDHVKGKVAVLRRGRIPFMEKVKRVKEKGAIGAIIVNNQEGPWFGQLETQTNFPVVAMEKDQGKHLLDWLKQNGKAKRLHTKMSIQELVLAPFSSKGPVTQSWGVKPDVVAPGVQITSTVPYGYERMNGTSMAAPYVTGVCALLKQAHPTWTVTDIKAALMNTGKPLARSDGSMYKTFEQGAGAIRIKQALETTTIMKPASFSLGVIPNRTKQNRTFSFILKNPSNKKQRYSFSDSNKNLTGLHFFFPQAVTLKPQEEQEIQISASIDGFRLKEKWYDGYVYVENEEQTIHLPYTFVVGLPKYPAVMAFNFQHLQDEHFYKYELYLPGGAEKLIIDLFDEETFRFVCTLDQKQGLKKGMYEALIDEKKLKEKGVFRALIHVQTQNGEETVESMIRVE